MEINTQYAPYPRDTEGVNCIKRCDTVSSERVMLKKFHKLESRHAVVQLVQNGLAAYRLARRANHLVLVDDASNYAGARKKINNKLKLEISFLGFLFFLLAGCSAVKNTEFTNQNKNHEKKDTLSIGLDELKNGRLENAAVEIKTYLNYHPTSKQGNALNAYLYEKQADSGEENKYQLALVGYTNVLKTDPQNKLALDSILRISLKTKDYETLQSISSRILMVNPQDKYAIKALIISSYYIGDFELAIWGIEKLKTLEKFAEYGNSDSLDRKFYKIEDAAFKNNYTEDNFSYKASALVYAVLGMEDNPRLSLTGNQGSDDEIKKIKQRVKTITELKQSLNSLPSLSATKNKFSPKREDITGSVNNDAIKEASTNEALSETVTKAWYDCKQMVGDKIDAPVQAQNSNQADESVILPALPSQCKGEKGVRMAVVDVQIISHRLTNADSFGVNLLDKIGFSVNRDYTKTKTNNSSDVVSIVDKASFALPPGATSATAALTYALNIANQSQSNVEVIARPSVLALDRRSSQFFSGSTLSIIQSGSTTTSAAVTDKPVGVSISFIPTFLSDDEMLISLKATRSFFEANSTTISSSINTVQLSRNMVFANARLRMGETMIVSGLAEREHDRVNDGVPILKDIPVLGNFFANTSTLEYNKSIIILITPRPADLLQETYAKTAEWWKARTSKEPLALKVKRAEAAVAIKKMAPNFSWALMRNRRNILVDLTSPGDLEIFEWGNYGKAEKFEEAIQRFILNDDGKN